MTRFRLHQDVAVVEHDDATRKPREGGRVHFGTVAEIGASLVKVNSDLPCAVFWQEVGWRVVDGGTARWRLVLLCHRCQEPITGEPVTDGADDPLGREWCSDECHDDSGQAWMEQHYRSA